MVLNKLIIIGLNHPEPETTAAGSRMLQLIGLFKEKGYQVTFLCTSHPSKRSFDLSSLGVETKLIHLNHSSFDNMIKKMNPDVVLFDRFIIEEQFGWRVAEHSPNTMRVLDTEDLHFLRKAREEAFFEGIELDQVDLLTETAIREIASIYRCDLSLIISEAEMELLQKEFNMNSELLYYLPFLIENSNDETLDQKRSFEQRMGFVTIGNFKHSPNVDSVIYLKDTIWPLIKKELPDAELSIYGAYAPDKLKRLHDDKEGFLIKGWAEDINEAMEWSRVCLCPLRFGAGLKGKIFDAMKKGTPCVTTNIGAEGILGDMDFCGIVSDNPKELAQSAVALYTQKEDWMKAQQNGFKILRSRFEKHIFSEELFIHLERIIEQLPDHRRNNFTGRILQHHTLKSTKYLSKWIEEKNS
jgi:hypothetical protein